VLAILLVLSALVLSALRLATPYLAKQRPAIERWASVTLKHPVEIDALQAGWDGLVPILKGKHVVIWNAGKTRRLLEVQEFDFGIDLWRSLFHARLQLGHLTISGAQFAFHQKPDGRIIFSGFGKLIASSNNTDDSGNTAEVLSWFLAQSKIELENIDIDWLLPNKRVLSARNLHVLVKNRGSLHIISGQATLVQKRPTQFIFVAHIKGDITVPGHFTAHLYGSANNLDLANWLQSRAIQGFTVTQGIANVQVWDTWQAGSYQTAQSLFAIRHLQLVQTGTKHPLNVPYINANVLWQAPQDGEDTVDALFKNIVFSRYGDLPGFNGLSGFVHADAHAGTLTLNSNNVQADFGKMFRHKLALTRLTGQISWEQGLDGYLVQAIDLQASTADAELKTTMGLWLPESKQSPVISLVAGLHIVGKAHLVDYLPLTVLSPGLVEWLDDSITAAQSVQSTLILRGPLDDFPFDKHNGTFLVDSQLTGLDLAYQRGWPPLKNMSGELIFSGRQMEIITKSAQVLASQVQQLKASIPVIEKNIPAVLKVEGLVKSSLQDAITFLKQSPLDKKLQGVADGMKAQGPLQLQLNLTIPLESKTAPIEVQGKAITNRAMLSIPDWNLQFSQLQGQLNFTQDALTAPKLTAMLWGKPVSIAIATFKGTPQINFVYSDVTGKLTPSKEAWSLAVQSPAMQQGQIIIPTTKGQPVQASFQKIIIPADGTSQDYSSLKPTSLPALRLTVNNLQYGQKSLGKIQLQLTPVPKGIQITQLTLTTPTASLAANGGWWQEKQGDTSQLQGEFVSPDIASTLKSLDFPSGLTAKQTRLRFNFTWPAPAYKFALNILSGNFDLLLQQGEFTDVGSTSAVKMGIGRLLNLLSLQSIERRLKLDFSDLTSRGFSFDKINGSFHLQNGNAYTQNASINGTIAQINIKGRIGLATEDYDLTASVTPDLTASLPLVVGLATGPVGPIAGAATWVASKVFSGAVNKITTDTYRMTGPWSKPNIVQSKGFWNGSRTPASKG
jgi:uncharacterized protein YhdP